MGRVEDCFLGTLEGVERGYLRLDFGLSLTTCVLFSLVFFAFASTKSKSAACRLRRDEQRAAQGLKGHRGSQGKTNLRKRGGQMYRTQRRRPAWDLFKLRFETERPSQASYPSSKWCHGFYLTLRAFTSMISRLAQSKLPCVLLSKHSIQVRLGNVQRQWYNYTFAPKRTLPSSTLRWYNNSHPIPALHTKHDHFQAVPITMEIGGIIVVTILIDNAVFMLCCLMP